MNRYYSSNLGRFYTPDPGEIRTSDPKRPGSWNRYAYVNNDPVNRHDPTGLCDEDDFDENWEGRCMDNDGSGGGGADLFDPYAGADPGGCIWIGDGLVPVGDTCLDGSLPEMLASPPKCWQDTSKIAATLYNLGTDIEADVANQFNSDDKVKLANDITSDITSELLAIGSGTTSSPYYIGGHFNLNILAGQIADFTAKDQGLFRSDFAGTGPPGSAGVRRTAVTGLAAGIYTLHSQLQKPDPGILPGEYSFHFDRFNRNSIPVGTILHGVYDWIGGHLGHPCLDPAWHQ